MNNNVRCVRPSLSVLSLKICKTQSRVGSNVEQSADLAVTRIFCMVGMVWEVTYYLVC